MRWFGRGGGMGEEGCHRLRCGRRGARASFLPGSGESNGIVSPAATSDKRRNYAAVLGCGGWPRLLIFRALPAQWVPRSFAFFAKGGSRKCRRQVGLITRPQQNQMAH